MSGPAICFYGDDFTGASENLAQFHKHGLRCRLYFEPADPQRVRAEAAELDVIGIAGVARSRAPDQMRVLLGDVPVSAVARQLGCAEQQLEVHHVVYDDGKAPVLAVVVPGADASDGRTVTRRQGSGTLYQHVKV